MISDRQNTFQHGFALFILMLSLAGLSLSVAIPGTFGPWPLPVLFVTLFAASNIKNCDLHHLCLISFTWLLSWILFPACEQWPFSMIVPVTVYFMTALAIPWTRKSIASFSFGKVDPSDWKWIFTISLLSGIALILWFIHTRPKARFDGIHGRDLLGWALPFAAMGFALLNAALEEILFRGLVMERMRSLMGSGWITVAMQGAFFAAFHHGAGFPRGTSGFLMVWIYGIALGRLYLRTGGLLAPWIAHVFADLVIFFLLASPAR